MKLAELEPEYLERRITEDRRSVSEIAEDAGVAPQTIYMYLRGKHSITVENLKKILGSIKKRKS